MIGLLNLVLSYKFLIGLLIGSGGLYIYLIVLGNKISWKKVQ